MLLNNRILTFNAGTKEQDRQSSPLYSHKQWDAALRKNNFTGVEVCSQDYAEHRHSLSVITSTAKPPVLESLASPTTLIIIQEGSSLQSKIAQQIEVRLQKLGCIKFKTLTWREMRTQDLKKTFCIFLLEIESLFLYGIQEDDFLDFKRVACDAAGILWVTDGGGASAQRPEVGLITGLGHTLRSENAGLNFIELILEGTESSVVAKHIAKIYQQARILPTTDNDADFVEIDGVLHISRVVEANAINKKLHLKLTAEKHPEMLKFQDHARDLTLTIGTPGFLDSLQFAETDVAGVPLLSEEVEIQVMATGVNFKDVVVAMGQIPSNILGLECSGIITRVGREVQNLKVGDRVYGLASGCYGTRVRTHAMSVTKMKGDMSFASAAALPVVFCTAYYGLVTLANLQSGESILIHSGAGGVGQAAIQIAKMIKAEIFVTVGNIEKKKLLADLYDIPEDHTFSSRTEEFAKKIKTIKPGGVDVILNSLSGAALRISWNCIAPLGRFIEIGKRDILAFENLSMTPFAMNVTFASVDLGVIAEKSKPLIGRLMSSVNELVSSDHIQPPQPLHCYKVSEIENAFRYLQSGRNTGKTVIEMHKDEIVPVSIHLLQ